MEGAITENELLKELMARVPDTQLETDVTPTMLKESLEKEGKFVSSTWTQRWLKDECKAGRLYRVNVILKKGGRGFVFRKPRVVV